MILADSIRDELVAFALAALPHEFCGLLAGPDGEAFEFFPIRNVDRSPSTFRMHAGEQLAAFDEIEERGWSLVAVVHSHPAGPCWPSGADRDQAFYPGALSLVLSLADPDAPELRAFDLVDGEVRELALELA